MFIGVLRTNNPTLTVGKLGHRIKVITNDPWRKLPIMLALKKKTHLFPLTTKCPKMTGADSEMTGDVRR